MEGGNTEGVDANAQHRPELCGACVRVFSHCLHHTPFLKIYQPTLLPPPPSATLPPQPAMCSLC